jgi:hypothetical protein
MTSPRRAGKGFHLDRAAFDAMLMSVAAAAHAAACARARPNAAMTAMS